MNSSERRDRPEEGEQLRAEGTSGEPSSPTHSASPVSTLVPPPVYWAYDSFGAKIRDQGTPVSAVWRIHYCATSGELTVRTVELTHVLISAGRVYLHGYCRLRSEARSFDVSRIQRAYDMRTARQIVDVASAARQLAPNPALQTPSLPPSGRATGSVRSTSLTFSERLAAATQQLLAELRRANATSKARSKSATARSAKAPALKPARAPKSPKLPGKSVSASARTASPAQEPGLSPALRQAIRDEVRANLLQQAVKPAPPPLPSETPWYDPSDPDDSERQARWAAIKSQNF